MKTKLVLFSFWLTLVGLGNLATMQVLAQEQDEDVRGAFLTTRPKTVEKNTHSGPTARPNRRRPKNTTTKQTTSTEVTAKVTVKTSESGPAKMTSQRIGLGVTLFTRDNNGLTVRVDPTHEFHKGDRIRLLLETNADGYLYIFDSTDGGQPVMIYPNPDLDEAGNFIQGHVPVELPSSVASEERLRWLTFDEHAGMERLYLVLTREPLATVPLEDDLISFCRVNNANCPLHPGSDLWAQLQKESKMPVKVDKAQKFGKAQTESEHVATTRGIGLSKEDPQPSVIMLTASSNTGKLVTTLDLIHK